MPVRDNSEGACYLDSECLMQVDLLLLNKLRAMNQRLWYKVYKDNNQVGRRKYITAQYGSKEEVENLLESHKAFSKLKEYTLGLEDQNEDEEAWESVTSLPKGDITVIISQTAGASHPAFLMLLMPAIPCGLELHGMCLLLAY